MNNEDKKKYIKFADKLYWEKFNSWSNPFWSYITGFIFLSSAIYMSVLLGYSFVRKDYITVIIGGVYILIMSFGAYFFLTAAIDLHKHKSK